MIILIALMVMVHTPFVWFTVVMSLISAVFGALAIADRSAHSYLVIAISMLLMWLISFLGWNTTLCLIPIAIMAINAILCGVLGGLVTCVVLLSMLLCSIVQERMDLNAACTIENRIEGTITEIEKRDYNDIMVVLETSDGIKILPFSSSVEDAWKLDKGDKIYFNVHKNKIIAFEPIEE